MKLSYRNQRNARIVAEYYNKPLDKPDWYTIKAAADGEAAELLVYDYIGWPYNDAGVLVRSLSEMKDTPILARINSPGGDVFDGMAILNAFGAHRAGVTIRIEALAASIASVLAMGGRKVQAYPNTMMMIHDSWCCVAGNKKELRETADLLDQIDENIMSAYTAKTKIGKKEMRDMMAAETWMNAKTMKEKGFIDEIIQSGKAAKAQFDLSIFDNAPEEIGGKPTIRQAEKALRDVGFSAAEAKAMLAGRGTAPGGDQRDVDDLAATIKSFTDNLKA